MSLTEKKLKQLIKEELQKIYLEQAAPTNLENLPASDSLALLMKELHVCINKNLAAWQQCINKTNIQSTAQAFKGEVNKKNPNLNALNQLATNMENAGKCIPEPCRGIMNKLEPHLKGPVQE